MVDRYLGQFVDENAETIVERLDGEGIRWHAKTNGRLARTLFAGDWGTRLFVGESDEDRAREIAHEIAPHGLAPRRRR